MSNEELARYVDSSLEIFAEAILGLRRQQEALTERIAFVAPTDSEILAEVETFIHNSLAA